jgi:hypothetical protein
VALSARGVRDARDHHGRCPHDCVARSDLPVAGCAFRLHYEHQGSTGSLPGKEDRTRGSSTMRSGGEVATWQFPAMAARLRWPARSEGCSYGSMGSMGSHFWLGGSEGTTDCGGDGEPWR